MRSNHTKDIQYPNSLSQGTTGINALMTALVNQKLGLVPLPRKGRLCIRPCTLFGVGLHNVRSSRKDNHAQELRVGTLCRGMNRKPISMILSSIMTSWSVHGKGLNFNFQVKCIPVIHFDRQFKMIQNDND